MFTAIHNVNLRKIMFIHYIVRFLSFNKTLASDDWPAKKKHFNCSTKSESCSSNKVIDWQNCSAVREKKFKPCVCIELHSLNQSLLWVRTASESENSTLSGIWFCSPFFSISGLVFTGCFICLIYVLCPDCGKGLACNDHMVVPHALMRCPISRNTNRVLRPSLWLYDVWTHKSFPETPDECRFKSDQARGPSIYFWVALRSVTWLTARSYIKSNEEHLKDDILFIFLTFFVIQLFTSWQDILLQNNLGSYYILAAIVIFLLRTGKCSELWEPSTIPPP